jgi:arginine exporter protein ArgO
MHRWWLALLAALLTPWLGPHIDGYLPVGMVLLRATRDAPDAGFWVLAGVLLAVEYALWFALLSGLIWLSRWRNRRNPPDAQR